MGMWSKMTRPSPFAPSSIAHIVDVVFNSYIGISRCQTWEFPHLETPGTKAMGRYLDVSWFGPSVTFTMRRLDTYKSYTRTSIPKVSLISKDLAGGERGRLTTYWPRKSAPGATSTPEAPPEVIDVIVFLLIW